MKIYNTLLIATILLVYSIFEPKNLFTALMPSQVNPRILPLENHIASAHFCEMREWFNLSQNE
jgi:hypothetical protein